jgi:hypothetical protein
VSRRTLLPASVALVALLVAACASATSGPRFVNAPPVQVVDDRRDVPVKPDVHDDLQTLEFWDTSVERPITRALELPRHRRALGINSLDEVPDSTWFTNRIGVRELTPEDIKRGPLPDEGPEQHMPWTVDSTKQGGAANAGVIITDARGVKYMLKFDRPGYEEMELGAHVLINRLIWACGYHVPVDDIVHFRPAELKLDPKATLKGRVGDNVGALTREALDKGLADLKRDRDGRVRALASRWIDGKPLGGYPPEGVRKGDPNDRIPHELRRDLRGEYPIFEWVDHTEVNQSNFFDSYVEDPGDKHRHYVEHYQMDFGAALGAKGTLRGDRHQGRMSEFSFSTLGYNLVTLGMDDRRNSQYTAPEIPGVARAFVARGFDPSRWTSDEPYAPFVEADRYDKFWGAAILSRFTPAQIRAAVEAAQFSDPRATEYITKTLLARQRAIVAHWFDQGVNPLSGFTIVSGALCFDDLAIRADLASSETTQYAMARFSEHLRPLGAIRTSVATAARTCVPIMLDNAYSIVRITTQRPRFRGDTLVHLARDPATNDTRVIGVYRP